MFDAPEVNCVSAALCAKFIPPLLPDHVPLALLLSGEDRVEALLDALLAAAQFAQHLSPGAS
jgi:hypothetical protein